jgi:dTDP-4-dehydrorhamnose reductase
MRLLITGWQGQLAQALVARSVRNTQVEACAVGRPALDLCSMPTIERSMIEVRPTLVINTAAYTAVDAAETDEAAAFALNAEGAGKIAHAAAQRGIPIIHVSTDYVYDGGKATPYVETDATNPINVYGRSKLAGEDAVAKANPQHVILRTSWIYSATGKNFVKTMLRLAADRPKVAVVDDQFGCPTFAPHLADTILHVAQCLATPRSAPPWGVYHATGTGETSWHGFATALFGDASARGMTVPEVAAITTAQYPTPARRPANSRLDCGKLARAFQARQPEWRTGLKDCLDELGVGA